MSQSVCFWYIPGPSIQIPTSLQDTKFAQNCCWGYLLTPYLLHGAESFLRSQPVNFAASQEIPRIYGTRRFLTASQYLCLHGQEVHGPTNIGSYPKDMHATIPACHIPRVPCNVFAWYVVQTSQIHAQRRKSSSHYLRIGWCSVLDMETACLSGTVFTGNFVTFSILRSCFEHQPSK
jgi:hypothetical protein